MHEKFVIFPPFLSYSSALQYCKHWSRKKNKKMIKKREQNLSIYERITACSMMNSHLFFSVFTYFYCILACGKRNKWCFKIKKMKNKLFVDCFARASPFHDEWTSFFSCISFHFILFFYFRFVTVALQIYIVYVKRARDNYEYSQFSKLW